MRLAAANLTAPSAGLTWLSSRSLPSRPRGRGRPSGASALRNRSTSHSDDGEKSAR